MKSATVYKRKGKFLFHPESKTTAGAWIGHEPNIIMATDSPTKEIGETILKVINSSKIGVPHPTDWKAFDKNNVIPFIQLAGVKSWSSFIKGTLNCTVEEDSGMIKITPSINLGKDGFEPSSEKEIKISAESSVEEIGMAILKGFELCE
jgi:hypothetical protein